MQNKQNKKLFLIKKFLTDREKRDFYQKSYSSLALKQFLYLETEEKEF